MYNPQIWGMLIFGTRDLQKGSAEMIVLALLEGRARHGYELAKLIESQSENKLQFHVASLYPLLYRLERKLLVEGRWVEKAGERRRWFTVLHRQAEGHLPATAALGASS